MCEDAELFVEGASRLDVNQGILGIYMSMILIKDK